MFDAKQIGFGVASATIVAGLYFGVFPAPASESGKNEWMQIATIQKNQQQTGESSTPQQVFDGMRDNFRADKAKGERVRYLFKLSGPMGGEWWIDVNDGAFKMGRGKIDNPDVTFVASDKDWVALSNGTLGGKWAYFTGRLKIMGDKGLAKKLDEIFP